MVFLIHTELRCMVNHTSDFFFSFRWNSLRPIGHPARRRLVKFNEGPTVIIGTGDTKITLCSARPNDFNKFKRTAWLLCRNTMYCLHLLSFPQSIIHLWCCAVLSAKRRCCCVACSCVAMRSYPRIKFESLQICTPALLNDVGREELVKKKVSLHVEQSTLSRAFLWSKKWMWCRFSLSSES